MVFSITVGKMSHYIAQEKWRYVLNDYSSWKLLPFCRYKFPIGNMTEGVVWMFFLSRWKKRKTDS